MFDIKHLSVRPHQRWRPLIRKKSLKKNEREQLLELSQFVYRSPKNSKKEFFISSMFFLNANFISQSFFQMQIKTQSRNFHNVSQKISWCIAMFTILSLKVTLTNKLKYLNLKPSFKLQWYRAQDLFESQIPVTTGDFELQISCMRSSYLTH